MRRRVDFFERSVPRALIENVVPGNECILNVLVCLCAACCTQNWAAEITKWLGDRLEGGVLALSESSRENVIEALNKYTMQGVYKVLSTNRMQGIFRN